MKFEKGEPVTYHLTGQKVIIKTVRTSGKYRIVTQFDDIIDNVEEKELQKIYMNYNDAMTKLIIGQKVASHQVFIESPYNDERRFRGFGVQFENGYYLIFEGYGSSGYDYMDSYIVDKYLTKVAEFECE